VNDSTAAQTQNRYKIWPIALPVMLGVARRAVVRLAARHDARPPVVVADANVYDTLRRVSSIV